MAIDPSISLNARAPQVEDPLAQYGKALNIKQMLQQTQAQDETLQRQERVRQILRQSMGKITPEILNAIRAEDPAAAFVIEEQSRKGQESEQGLQKGQQDLEAGEQKLEKADLEAWAGLASTIKDDATKAAAIGTALQRKFRGVPREELIELLETPYEQAKPIIDGFRQQVLTEAQRLEALDRAATEKRLTEQAAETARHNKILETPAAEREFKPFYESWLQGRPPNAKLEFEARQEFRKPQRADQLLTRDEEEQRKRINASRGIGTGSDANDNIKLTAQGIAEGRLPPPDVSSRPTQYSMALTGELQRMGYDLTKASRDWKAVQKHMSTLNGAQQLRLRQAVDAVFQHTDLIESLYGEWKAVGRPSGFKILNKANLALAKQLPGRAGEVAQGLEAQVNDLISELGTAYKGGNSSTDETLRLAAENLKADWNEEQFSRALKLIKQNMQIRKNSIESTQPSGVSEGSPYVPEVKAQPHAPATSGPQIGQVVKLRNGKSIKITAVHPDGTFDGDEVK